MTNFSINHLCWLQHFYFYLLCLVINTKFCLLMLLYYLSIYYVYLFIIGLNCNFCYFLLFLLLVNLHFIFLGYFIHLCHLLSRILKFLPSIKDLKFTILFLIFFHQNKIRIFQFYHYILIKSYGAIEDLLIFVCMLLYAILKSFY